MVLSVNSLLKILRTGEASISLMRIYKYTFLLTKIFNDEGPKTEITHQKILRNFTKCERYIPKMWVKKSHLQ